MSVERALASGLMMSRRPWRVARLPTSEAISARADAVDPALALLGARRMEFRRPAPGGSVALDRLSTSSRGSAQSCIATGLQGLIRRVGGIASGAGWSGQCPGKSLLLRG